MTKTTRRQTLQLFTAGAALGLAPGFFSTAARAEGKRIAMVVKNLGNSYFDACAKGGTEAVTEVGGFELIYTASTKATAEEQIALFDKIPDSYVLEYFKNIDGQKVEFEKLISAYRSANLDSLWLLIQDEESGALLNDELITLRNYRMTERIVPLIKQQPTFVAIGTGHLPGEEGVIALLRKEGYIVEPEKLW
jgi:hypothetical protein